MGSVALAADSLRSGVSMSRGVNRDRKWGIRPEARTQKPLFAGTSEFRQSPLVSIGLVDEDPLRVAAEAWLADHQGPQTEATLAVRRALGNPYPAWMQRAADRFQSYDTATGKGAFRRAG
jgi:hypothetical protein